MTAITHRPVILWVSKEHTKRPNDQRAELVEVVDGDTIIVEMCGDNRRLALHYSAVVGVELVSTDGKRDLDLFFKTSGLRYGEHS